MREPSESGRVIRSHWSQSCRRVWATGHGDLGLNLDPLQKQYVLQAAEPHLQPIPDFFFFNEVLVYSMLFFFFFWGEQRGEEWRSCFLLKIRKLDQMIFKIPKTVRFLRSVFLIQLLKYFLEDSVPYECHYSVLVMKFLMLKYYTI